MGEGLRCVVELVRGLVGGFEVHAVGAAWREELDKPGFVSASEVVTGSSSLPVALADLLIQVVLAKFYHRWHCLTVEDSVGDLVVPVIVGFWALGLDGESGSKRRQRQEGV